MFHCSLCGCSNEYEVIKGSVFLGIRGFAMWKSCFICFDDSGVSMKGRIKVLSSYRDSEGRVCQLVANYSEDVGYVYRRFKRSSFNGRGASDWIHATKARLGALFARRVNWSEGHSYHFGKG